MDACVRFCVLMFLLAFSTAASTQEERELIQDNRFHNGFVLSEPKPGNHVRYGELTPTRSKLKPAWGLLQWSSQFPLDPMTAVTTNAAVVCSNSAKAIRFGQTSGADADLRLSLNTEVEYGAHARKAGDPWVHLLVEQQFESSPALDELTSARLHVEARLAHSQNLHHGDYSPDLHAAQFQIFFTVQNLNRQSPGYGDMLWFGIPIYDNRDRFPKAFKAQDFGGTAKFIYTPDGKTFSSNSAHDGKWITIHKDLLPLMREALQTAWAGGFLKDSRDLGDYHIGGMNMGWELPGTFDVQMQVRRLSMKLRSTK